MLSPSLNHNERASTCTYLGRTGLTSTYHVSSQHGCRHSMNAMNAVHGLHAAVLKAPHNPFEHLLQKATPQHCTAWQEDCPQLSADLHHPAPAAAPHSTPSLSAQQLASVAYFHHYCKHRQLLRVFCVCCWALLPKHLVRPDVSVSSDCRHLPLLLHLV